jgi:diguanylate cyclase (GGDEF)-like protein
MVYLSQLGNHMINSESSTKGEVAGSFLLGLVESFYHLQILPQGDVSLSTNDLAPEKWYPYSMLIETLRSIEQAVPSSANVFFRAGVNFLRTWYEQGPGKTMIHSGLDWLYANSESQGYNSVVRGGNRDEIGWSLLQSIDEKAGIAVYENVMPLNAEYVRGVFYGGCVLFDDMDYVDVEASSERYAPNPLFNRIIITVRFRLKSKTFGKDLESRINRLQLGDSLTLSPDEVESLIWRMKGLQVKIGLDAAYFRDINMILAAAITTSQAQHDEIIKLSNHDVLTGLPNLRLARDRLKMVCSQAARNRDMAALLFIDLDGFKRANDTFGHEAGDHILKVVAQRLRCSIREVDTAARLGGDEFIIILNSITDADSAELVAGKIIAVIAEPIYHNDHLLVIGSSIGIALCPDHATDPEDLLKKADEAMYSVKRSGKNNFSMYMNV